MQDHIRKYPRTPHIESSKFHDGDHDLEATPFRAIAGQHLVVEEKLDGANAGISFDGEGNLRLQSRGHFLTGGGRERHFNLFKQWANQHVDRLFDILGDRYIMYGEWMYSKHTVYYDQLPHYFLEFDILDRATGAFLSTPERRRLIGRRPVVGVPVLFEGEMRDLDELRALVRPSLYKSAGWKESLRRIAGQRGLDFTQVQSQTSASDMSEGLYIKVESEGRVTGRYKYVRPDFLQAIVESDSHWLDRPIVPNQLLSGVDLFAPGPGGSP